MSNVILGNKARELQGIRARYNNTLDPVYQGYIDTLYAAMIGATYDRTNALDCIITQTFNLNITQNQIDLGLDSSVYALLEDPIIKLCTIHNCYLTITRQPQAITVVVDLKTTYGLVYT